MAKLLNTSGPAPSGMCEARKINWQWNQNIFSLLELTQLFHRRTTCNHTDEHSVLFYLFLFN